MTKVFITRGNEDSDTYVWREKTMWGITGGFVPSLLPKEPDNQRRYISLWPGGSVGASSYTLKGSKFDSWSEHITILWVWSPVMVLTEAMDQCLSFT